MDPLLSISMKAAKLCGVVRNNGVVKEAGVFGPLAADFIDNPQLGWGKKKTRYTSSGIKGFRV